MALTNVPGNRSADPLQRRRGMLLLNPAFMYAATWMFVLLLYSLGLSELLEPLRPSTVLLVTGTSAAFIAGWVLESLPTPGRFAFMRIDPDWLGTIVNSNRVKRRLTTLWAVFGIGIGFEVAFFGGAPLLGLVGIGPEILYTDFGIPGVHGVLNSMYYAGCAILFTRVLLGSSRRGGLLAVVSLAYPMLGMSRQILISLMLQYLFIYFSIRRPSPVVFLRAGALFVATFLVFGYLGDIRSGRDNIIAVAAPTFEYPDWLPSAFIWFYLYLATPLNNVNFNIDLTPNYFPLETASTFIPSFAREEFLNVFGGTRQWGLVTDTFNVSSLLQSLLTDFGVLGSIAFALLCGIGLSRLLRRARRSAVAFFAVIVMLHGLALSFFANLLFHLVFMFEIVAVAWVVAGGRRR